MTGVQTCALPICVSFDQGDYDLGNMYIQLWRMLEEADGENFEAIDGSLSY